MRETGPRTSSSSLVVREATLADSGQYACHASVGSAANVTVHVIRSKSAEISNNISLKLEIYHLNAF